ncbi:MAG: hypothetical protein JSS86_04160 [Cyanobacteria bacterium SZAS LIN-2]|nr:hypothetical protein [Cyanobacteria bacterium SZAS LIN-3]MBS1995475.1 hypothetical protein [Cyanobacteria bacterium SZAS LIN-2]MBS2006030.1 hypothetical protein [Cyanobacteria bacterium SZAS TMP-1]
MGNDRHTAADAARDHTDAGQSSGKPGGLSNLQAEGYPDKQKAAAGDGKPAGHAQDQPPLLPLAEIQKMLGTESQFVAREMARMEKKYHARADEPDKMFHGIAKDAFVEFKMADGPTQEKYRKFLGLGDGPVTPDKIYEAQMAQRRATLDLKDPNDLNEMMRKDLAYSYRHVQIDYN